MSAEPGAPERDVSMLRKASAFRVGTRASTTAEFVEAFCRFADPESLFLPVAQPLPLGRRLNLRVTLLDGTTVMSGEVEVIEAVSDRRGSFGRNGMRVRLVRVDDEVRALHQALVARRSGLASRGPLPGMPPTLGEGSGVGATVARSPAASSGDEPEGMLPANPLAALTAEMLEHFVDCAIFEDGVDEFGGQDTAVDAPLPEEGALRGAFAALPAGAAPVVPVPAVTAAPAAPRSSLPSPLAVVGPPPLPLSLRAPPPPLPPVDPGLLRRAVTAPPGAMPMPIATPPPPTTPRGMALDSPFTTRSTRTLDLPPPPAEVAGAAPVAPVPTVPPGVAAGEATDLSVERAPRRRRPPWVVGLAAGAFLALGTLVAWLSWGRAPVLAGNGPVVPAIAPALLIQVDEDAVAPAAPAVAEGAPSAPAAPSEAEAAPAAPAVVAAPAPAAPAAPPAPAVADGAPGAPAAAATTCRLSVVTNRPGASVHVDDMDLGATPVEDAEVDCHGLLVIEHPRYKRIERPLELEPGTPGRIEEKLVRPSFPVMVRSTPPGADVLLDGQPVGVTPLRLDLLAFEQTSVTVSLAEHRVWSQTVYVKGAMALDVPLEPLARPKPRPKARPR